MFIYPPIERLGGRVLNKQSYRDGLVNGWKGAELDVLRTKACVAPAPLPYSHFAFHLGKSVTKGKQVPILVGINLGSLGSFKTADDAWRAAEENNVKLGMGLEELERFMTRIRTDRKTNIVSEEVIPVMLHMVGGVHETNAVEWIDGDGNQAGFRRHWFQPKGTTSPSDRVCLFRYRDIGGDCAAAAAQVGSANASAVPVEVSKVDMAMRGASAWARAPAGRVECGAGALVVGSWARKRGTRSTARRAGSNGLRRLGSSRSIICRPRVVLPIIPRKQLASGAHL
jgi:hypothetical protein